MRRRNLMFGLGSIAFGSGALTSMAAFNDTVGQTSDMRVVAAADLQVRAGQAFDPGGTVRSGSHPDFDGDPSRYVEYDSLPNSEFFEPSSDPEPQGLKDIDTDDLPVATVNRRDQNTNDDVIIQVAVPVDPAASNDKFTFNQILEVYNGGTGSVKVGVSYDRDKNQYGNDVNPGGDPQTELTHNDVQHIYRFQGYADKVTRARISPDHTDDNVPPREEDDPENVIRIDPDETMRVDLDIDLSDYALGSIDVQQQIRDAANPGNPFGGQEDTVDMLDEITFGTEDPNDPFP